MEFILLEIPANWQDISEKALYPMEKDIARSINALPGTLRTLLSLPGFELMLA